MEEDPGVDTISFQDGTSQVKPFTPNLAAPGCTDGKQVEPLLHDIQKTMSTNLLVLDSLLYTTPSLESAPGGEVRPRLGLACSH